MNKAGSRNNLNHYFIKDNQQGSLKISDKLSYSYLYTTAGRAYASHCLALAGRSQPRTLIGRCWKTQRMQKAQQSKTINSDVVADKSFYLSRDVQNPNYLYFLGGFVEGEGSNSVAVSVGKEFKFGVNLQPIFNVSQHVNGINILYSFKELFGAGSVVKKSGSEDV